MNKPARSRRVVVPGDPLPEAVQDQVAAPVETVKPKGSSLPTPDEVDSSQISHMVLTTEGWVAGACVPGGGK